MISFSFRCRAVVRDPASLSAEVNLSYSPYGIRSLQILWVTGRAMGILISVQGHCTDVDSSNGPEPLYTPVKCRTRKDFWIRKVCINSCCASPRFPGQTGDFSAAHPLWSARPEEMLAYTWRSPNLGNNGIVTCGDRFSHTVTNVQVILRLAGLSRAPQRKPHCSVMLISMLPLYCLPPRVHDPSVPSS
ncbi:hypothetical protein CH63R_07377 [Colletotrichum higginsianum IMI 349063]|uniref:Uncharacterized protein n=1 Tax=Colletotrichum higginsianum (strain IMI 349063) TaxID=759273 RepID=A0A1B7Y995_COLHI|nr:hypothetical protein CH63R_07377 [Colletotrichum higginsianum IMI 349063]OBR08612.1 hypothetical protein CH63R_07377 [Colletotrichum higginsianum IMI 349063]